MKNKIRVRLWAVWLCRLCVGATFVVSGWAKAIDPWGFVIKVGQYLDAWHMSVPPQAIVTACIALACVEFATGVMLMTGSLKRMSVAVASAMMAVFLPLTVYIAIASPVADCGCFGDMIVLGNGTTLIKNIVICVLLAYLIPFNRQVRGIYPPAVQWLAIAASLAYPLYLAIEGYNVQPMADFRPYPTGTTVFIPSENVENARERYVYEKAGHRRAFTLDALPDSTWTFVEATEPEHAGDAGMSSVAVYDSEGYDIASELAHPADGAPAIYMTIPRPSLAYMLHAHYVNRLYRSALDAGVHFVAIVGGGDDAAQKWTDLVRPEFDIYTADANSLRQLVRGVHGMVYVDGNGTIKWKRTLESLSVAVPDADVTAAASLEAPDSTRRNLLSMIIYIAVMTAIFMLGLLELTPLFGKSKTKSS